jgi:putative hydrolase of the HAD superfamily
MGDVAACLIDVYQTTVSCDFAAHGVELPALAGVPAEVWRPALARLAPALGCGRMSMADAYAQIIRQSGGEPGEDLILALVQRDRELLCETARLYDDTIPFLERLRRRGIATALVSNCMANTRELLVQLGIGDLVDTVVLSCEVGGEKPDPAVYRAALDHLGVPAADALFIDDQLRYCEGARAVGVRAVRLDRLGVSGAVDGAALVRSLSEVDALL